MSSLCAVNPVTTIHFSPLPGTWKQPFSFCLYAFDYSRCFNNEYPFACGRSQSFPSFICPGTLGRVVSTAWLWWITLVQTLIHYYLFESLLSVLLINTQKQNRWIPWFILCVTCWGKCHALSCSDCITLHSHQQYKNISTSVKARGMFYCHNNARLPRWIEILSFCGSNLYTLMFSIVSCIYLEICIYLASVQFDLTVSCGIHTSLWLCRAVRSRAKGWGHLNFSFILPSFPAKSSRGCYQSAFTGILHT